MVVFHSYVKLPEGIQEWFSNKYDGVLARRNERTKEMAGQLFCWSNGLYIESLWSPHYQTLVSWGKWLHRSNPWNTFIELPYFHSPYLFCFTIYYFKYIVSSLQYVLTCLFAAYVQQNILYIEPTAIVRSSQRDLWNECWLCHSVHASSTNDSFARKILTPKKTIKSHDFQRLLCGVG